MRTASLSMMVALALLAGCKKAEPGSRSAPDAFTTDAGSAAAGDKQGAAGIKVSLPQIAYAYHYSFSLPTADIATVQQRHIALCDRLGPASCHVLDMEGNTRDGVSTGGTLKLEVAAVLARSFEASLVKAVNDSGGRRSDSRIEAEDLSKQIVDVEARLRSKQALADRLMTLLKTRSGPVSDLVEAERQVASVQEEIDAAQSELADARGRVAMSTFELSYQSDGALSGGFLGPLRSSFGTMGSFLGQSLSMLITLIAVLLPWTLLGGAAFFGVRAVRRRIGRADEE